MTEADLAAPPPTPLGTTIPAWEMLDRINGVTVYRQGRLNYIQPIYGDMDPNMPPGWGQEYAG
jgi:hypothetical protein